MTGTKNIRSQFSDPVRFSSDHGNNQRAIRARKTAGTTIMAINPSEKPPSEDGVIQPATTEQILGRPVDAADKDPVRLMGGAHIDPKWKKHYESLLQIRDGII